MLVEFPSVVNAVACAVEVQRGMQERNADVSQDRRIEFRIGVNLGDAIVEGDTFSVTVSMSQFDWRGSPNLAGLQSLIPSAIRLATGWTLFSRTWASKN